VGEGSRDDPWQVTGPGPRREEDGPYEGNHVLGRDLRSGEPAAPRGWVFESRMFNTPKGLVSGYFDNFYDFARALEPWHGTTSIYITLNRLKPELLARARNRFLSFARITTASDDVMARQWFGNTRS
jgi:hypothetical protein